MREVIAKLPKGTWTNAMRIDGFDAPLDLEATLTIEDDIIRVDFAGTSGVSRYGINCPLCYTEAYTSFGVKCLVAPRLANNAAMLERIRITAPENTIVNALPPAPVTGRAHRPDAARCRLRVLRQGDAGRGPAEGTAASWSLRIGGGPGLSGRPRQGDELHVAVLPDGGMGAHPTRRPFGDALSVRRRRRSPSRSPRR